LRVERQDPLQALQAVHRQQPDQVEDEHRRGIRLPAHLLVRVHARRSIDEALEPAECAVQPERLVLIHAGHVRAERLGQHDQNDHVQSELKDSVSSHEKSSGLSSARTRYKSNPTDTIPPMT
jgi:hypothetical protein